MFYLILPGNYCMTLCATLTKHQMEIAPKATTTMSKLSISRSLAMHVFTFRCNQHDKISLKRLPGQPACIPFDTTQDAWGEPGKKLHVGCHICLRSDFITSVYFDLSFRRKINQKGDNLNNGWQDGLQVRTLPSKLSNLGSNLNPAINCLPDVSITGRFINVCPVPLDGH